MAKRSDSTLLFQAGCDFRAAVSKSGPSEGVCVQVPPSVLSTSGDPQAVRLLNLLNFHADLGLGFPRVHERRMAGSAGSSITARPQRQRSAPIRRSPLSVVTPPPHFGG